MEPARAAAIVGLSGTELQSAEAQWLAAARPAGLILFARNCASPVQVRTLVTAAKTAIGTDDVLVLIDQEGGRVRRMRPPVWRDIPSARRIVELEREQAGLGIEAACLIARMTAEELRESGVTVNCAPVLDLEVPGAHHIIGDRAYGATAGEIVPLARGVMEGYIAGGVVPVIKHIPGHGRALADSHLELPVVSTSLGDLMLSDFVPFRELASAPAAMTAHVVYSAIDPLEPASTSAKVIEHVIRGDIGFDGLLMSDDLGMKALSGDIASRAAAVLKAGCDVALECSGDLATAMAAVSAVPVLDGPARARFEACFAVIRSITPFDRVRADEMWRLAISGEPARKAAGRTESV